MIIPTVAFQGEGGYFIFQMRLRAPQGDSCSDETGSTCICMCRMGRASAVTSWLAEPPLGTVVGVEEEPYCRSHVWGEGCISQNQLGYAAVTTPGSQWLKTIEVISLSHYIYVCQWQVI